MKAVKAKTVLDWSMKYFNNMMLYSGIDNRQEPQGENKSDKDILA